MKPPSAQFGFTLIELLVSSAIIGIVMMVLLSVTSTGMQLWNSTESRISVDREGRGAQAMLALDMQSIIAPPDPMLWPKVNAATNASVLLRFLTVMPRDYQDGAADLGDVCYVEYRYDQSNRTLLRGFAGSAATFTSLVTSSFPALASTNFEVLATNIPQVKVWAWDVAGQPAPSNGPNPPSLIDVRMEILDSKDSKNFQMNEQLGDGRGFRSQRYYFSRFAVPPSQ